MATATSFGRLRAVGALAVTVFTPSIVGSCGDSRDSFRDDYAQFADAGPVLDAGDCNHTVCSRDLKQVLRGCEGSETVFETCGEGLGCGDGHCVPGCDSAALSKGSLGCEFATIPPDDRVFNSGDCFVSMIANTWDSPIAITAELGSESLDISQSVYTAQKDGANTTYTRVDGKLPPGQVGLVFLSEATDQLQGAEDSTLCPKGVVPAYRKDPMSHGTGITRAFHLKTDGPVSAYSIFPYGGAQGFVPTATLLLPVSSWGTNYLAVSTAKVFVDKSGGSPPNLGVSNRTLQLVAQEDGTEIQILPAADVSPVGGVAGGARGKPTTWSLSRGQVIQINQANDLTGSAIESNKPIGLFGGSECTNFPVTYAFCDLTQQQMPPLSQWGHVYALVPYRPRGGSDDAHDNVPWSFVGAADGTQLTYDPVRPLGAPETLAAGERVTFMTSELVSVRSQDEAHPFHVSVYMTGQAYGGIGDPEFVNVVSSAQFLDRYVFFADFTFADTSITLVRKKTAKGFSPVRLACSGEITDWKPLGNRGDYEYAWVQLTRNHATVKRDDGTECGYGLHVAESDGPFGVTVWGVDSYASYGIPGGSGLRPLTNIQVPVR
ncbi:MAG: hypothetical protein K0S65_1798 [Labilithrix sp.]|nr:hypothetical protein [Labilithrix sp.]